MTAIERCLILHRVWPVLGAGNDRLKVLIVDVKGENENCGAVLRDAIAFVSVVERFRIADESNRSAKHLGFSATGLPQSNALDKRAVFPAPQEQEERCGNGPASWTAIGK